MTTIKTLNQFYDYLISLEDSRYDPHTEDYCKIIGIDTINFKVRLTINDTMKKKIEQKMKEENISGTFILLDEDDYILVDICL